MTLFAGLLCCSVGVFFFASPLIKLRHVIMTKNTEVLPFPIILTSFFVTLQWFIYGYLLGDSFIQIPNFLGCILSAIQLTLFVIYPSKSDIRYKPLSSIDFQSMCLDDIFVKEFILEYKKFKCKIKSEIKNLFNFFPPHHKFVKNFHTAVRARKSFLFLSFRKALKQ